jgi:glycosyltransferase involved in cell wall biosynthesis
MEYLASDAGVSVIRIPELVRPLSPWQDLVAFWRIYRFLRRTKPDVVHTHTSKAGTLGRLAAIFVGVPAVFHTFHGSVFDGYFSPAKTRLFLAIERLLAFFTDRVITVSDKLKKQLSAEYRIAPQDKIEVIRLGFDLREFSGIVQSGVRRTRGQVRGPLIVGWVGRLTEIKDPLVFVEVAATLKAAGLPARFIMIGDGPLRQVIEAAISERGLNGDLVVTGWQRNMPDVYSDLDLVVSTSANEGTPVTIIEAMAAGCPFVAPNVGGLEDLGQGLAEKHEDFDVYSNGILVSDRKAKSIANAVRFLAENRSLRERMGECGHHFALENFDQDRLVHELESLYEQFVRNARPVDGTLGEAH